MPINYPEFSDLNKQAQAELARQLPDIDPTISGSWARGFTTAGAALAYTVSLTVRDVQTQAFPQTATGEFLEQWGAYEALPRNPAAGAFGNVALPGVVGTIIPVNTSFTAGNGYIYINDVVGSVMRNSILVSTLVRVGSTVTATTPARHGLASNLDVTISGSTPTDYNGTFQIAVTSATAFTYEISGTPGVASGTITAASDFATLLITSQTTGFISNLSSGASISLSVPIDGVIEPGYVTFAGLVGGTSIETDAAYRSRILLSRSTVQGVFTPAQVRLAALSLSGNTRAFVTRPSFGVATTPAPGFVPIPGQVAIYIVRDNDDNIIPTQPILDATKALIIENGALPATTFEGDVFVFAPNTVTQDFTFSEITPSTATMQSAIIATLQAYFEDTAAFETTIPIETIYGVIANTVDTLTGDSLKDFTLTVPAGDIVLASGDIALLGEITFL
jgi:uncharacterized phage protein gp47/JayE